MTSQRQSTPATGEGGHVAPFGPRLLALLIDWIACVAIAYGLLAAVVDLGPAAHSFAPLGILLLEQVIGVSLGGAGLGHRLLRLRVVSLQGEWVTPGRALVRAVLLCLVIPPLVVGADGRGLHDVLAGTTIIRVR